MTWVLYNHLRLRNVSFKIAEQTWQKRKSNPIFASGVRHSWGKGGGVMGGSGRGVTWEKIDWIIPASAVTNRAQRRTRRGVGRRVPVAMWKHCLRTAWMRRWRGSPPEEENETQAGFLFLALEQALSFCARFKEIPSQQPLYSWQDMSCHHNS